MAISKSRDASEVVIGSFLNLSSVAQYLKSSAKDVIIHCAGWKGRFNLEDSLFAGALVRQLDDVFESDCDSVIAARILYDDAKNDMLSFLSKSSHVNRLRNFNTMKDVEFCLKVDEYDAIPVLRGKELVKIIILSTFNFHQ